MARPPMVNMKEGGTSSEGRREGYPSLKGEKGRLTDLSPSLVKDLRSHSRSVNSADPEVEQLSEPSPMTTPGFERKKFDLKASERGTGGL